LTPNGRQVVAARLREDDDLVQEALARTRLDAAEVSRERLVTTVYGFCSFLDRTKARGSGGERCG